MQFFFSLVFLVADSERVDRVMQCKQVNRKGSHEYSGESFSKGNHMIDGDIKDTVSGSYFVLHLCSPFWLEPTNCLGSLLSFPYPLRARCMDHLTFTLYSQILCELLESQVFFFVKYAWFLINGIDQITFLLCKTFSSNFFFLN